MTIMKLTIDFESRSACPLTTHGAWPYAAHRTTELMCMAVKVDDAPSRIWIPDYFKEIVNSYLDAQTFGGYDITDELDLISEGDMISLINKADIIEAHNAGFEKAMWSELCIKRMGWPKVPAKKWRCSAAKAAAQALPRALGDACDALNVEAKKDKEGRRIMLKLCKPRSARKNEVAMPGEHLWHEDPKDLLHLFHYCCSDTNAEYDLSEATRDLSLREQHIWFLDQEINERGIYIDINVVNAAIDMISTYAKRLNDELAELTKGSVGSVTEVFDLKKWLNNKGLKIPSLAADVVEKALKRTDLEPMVHRVLQIRASLSKSSTAKYKAMRARVGADSRVKGTLAYHAANTGRWGGQGVQTQNLPRGTFKDMDLLVSIILKGDLDMLEMFFEDPMEALSTAVRGAITAAPGNELMCADFSSIEARVLAWLAGEQKVLDAFIAGKDLYKVSGSGIYKIPYETVVDDKRQVGKVSVLALGYQGGWKAFHSMAKNYKLEVPEDVKITDPEELKNKYTGKKLTEELARWQKWASPIVDAWRQSHTKITRFWYNTEQDAIEAVRTGKAVTRGNITWGVKDDFLYCKLPSGRLLSYYKPALKEKKMPWGTVKESLSYMSVNGYTRQWERTFTYGGKLVENIVQAVARDLMAYAMIRVEKHGYPIVMTVHDEIVAELLKGTKDLKEYERLMAELPGWASGCPVTAEGWVGKRYRK